MQAAVASAVSVFCGQGARRARNWRHNRPNSPYRKAREAGMFASGSGLCPAQKAELEARLVEELKKQLQQQNATTDDC
jgi:hypothetical protein